MPNKDGFELLKHYPDPGFSTIFTTAYDQYAVQAMKFTALDYLLKPIDIDELVAAVKRCPENELDRDQQIKLLQEYLQVPDKKPAKIILPTASGYEIAEIESIVRIEADSNYSVFYYKDKRSTVVCRTLKYYDDLLKPAGFYRVHLTHIQKYNKGETPFVIMVDGSSVSVARNKKADFLSEFLDKMIH